MGIRKHLEALGVFQWVLTFLFFGRCLPGGGASSALVSETWQFPAFSSGPDKDWGGGGGDRTHGSLPTPASPVKGSELEGDGKDLSNPRWMVLGALLPGLSSV